MGPAMTTALPVDPAPVPAADASHARRRYTVDIDIGGTLTDGLYADGTTVTPVKVDTTPHDFTVCFFANLKEGARQLGFADLRAFLAEVTVIRWSATIATNIVAEGKGPKIGLLAGAGAAPGLYGDRPSPAVGRLVAEDDIVALAPSASDGETLAAIRALLERGVRRIVVSLDGAFTDNTREREIQRLIDRSFPDHYLGAVPTVLGSEICRHPDDQTRTHMALVNAYVHTPLAVALFKAEDELLVEHGYRRPVYIAHVNGGVARVAKTKAVDTAESSPYFGLSACAWWARRYGEDRVLALDVGGTTCKLGVIRDGEVMTVERGELLGVGLKMPWTLLRSDAIGGGSIARAAGGELTLGPESQGAFPGPAAYDLGGREATLTDAFVVSGMLNPQRFLGGRRELRADLAQEAISRAVAEPLGIEPARAAERIIDQAADGIAEVAQRAITDAGLDRGGFSLFCFGGNGGICAARVADRLGLERAFVFALGPVLSAFGSSVAEICHVHEQFPFLDVHAPDADRRVAEIVAAGLTEVRRDLGGEGLPVADARLEVEATVTRDGHPHSMPLPADSQAAGRAIAGLRAGHGVIDHVVVRGVSPVPVYGPAPAPEAPHVAAAAQRRAVGGEPGMSSSGRTCAPGRARSAPPSWSRRPTAASSRVAGRCESTASRTH